MRMRRIETILRLFQNTRDVEDAQQDEHPADREFHRQSQSRRDGDMQQNDGRTNKEDRQRMPDAPHCANQRRTDSLALSCDNGGYSDDVVGVKGMAHAQKEPEQQDRVKGNHGSSLIDVTPVAATLRK